MRSRYFAGANGAQFSYAVEPSYTCPLAPESEPKLLTGAAAALLDCDGGKLAKILERAHASHRQGRERDDAGRLTDRCAICGARMERVGFVAWADEPDTDEARGRIGSRLGINVMRTLKPRRYFDRKKDAIEWAREESKIHRAAAADQIARGAR